MIERVSNKDNTIDSDYLPNIDKMHFNSHLNMEQILARDQRTTSHRVIDNNRTEISNNQSNGTTSFGVTRIEDIIDNSNYDNNTNNINNNNKNSAKVFRAIGVERTTNGSTGSEDNMSSSKMRTSSNKRIRGYSTYRGFAVTWLRLGSLLVTLLVVSIHGAPTMTSPADTPTMWVNPCGLLQGEPEAKLENKGQPTEQVVTDYFFEDLIALQAKQASSHAQLFRQKIMETNFKSLTDLHDDWKSQRYDWLPDSKDIPKNLNESLSPEFLNNLDLDTALVNAYEIMQKYAVALEQVVSDQVEQSLPLKQGFKETEYQLRMVLCEINVALTERQVKPRPDVTRSIMPADIRKLGSSGDTFRDMRDWLIFRDYMNGLEYVEQVFNHFHERVKP